MSATLRRRDFLLYYAVQRLSLTKNFHRDPDSIRKIYLSCFITSIPYFYKAERVTVCFSFSCTSLLYYNLCLCKSFKEQTPFPGRKPQRNSLEERPSLFAVAKVHRFRTFHKHRHHFFRDKTKLFFTLIIYILRARYVFGISGAVLRVWGKKKAKREEDGFSGVPGGLPYRRIPVSRTGGTGRLGRRKQHGDSAGGGHSGTDTAFLTAFSVQPNGFPIFPISRPLHPVRMRGFWLAGKPFPCPRPTNRLKNLRMLGKTPNFALNLL